MATSAADHLFGRPRQNQSVTATLDGPPPRLHSITDFPFRSRNKRRQVSGVVLYCMLVGRSPNVRAAQLRQARDDILWVQSFILISGEVIVIISRELSHVRDRHIALRALEHRFKH